jgi:hypothetical protein
MLERIELRKAPRQPFGRAGVEMAAEAANQG